MRMRPQVIAAGLLLLGCVYGIGGGRPTAAPVETDSSREDPSHARTGKAGAPPSQQPTTRPYPNDYPTSDYEVRKVEGWTVYVHKELLAEKKLLGEQFLQFLQAKLLEVKVRVPTKAVRTLQTIKIWVEDRDSKTTTCYHWTDKWLKANGFNPDKSMSVHVCSASQAMHFGRWQTGIILHELAHGYHQRIRKQWGRQIDAAYREALKAGKYAAVARVTDPKKPVPAYAARNGAEYFAECTESYFMLNDFYPFFWAQLESYDPKMYELLGKAWCVERPLHYKRPTTRPGQPRNKGDRARARAG